MNLLEQISCNLFINTEEILELIKRLNISNYDEISPYIDEAYDCGVIEPQMSRRYVTQSRVSLIRDWLHKSKFE